MPYVILDTEYTTFEGALESDWSLPGQHKEVVQIAAIIVDDNFDEIDCFECLVKPNINPKLSDLFTNLTRITQDEVDKYGVSFSQAMIEFDQFCENGHVPILCMNNDENVLRINCDLNKTAFPFVNGFHRIRPLVESVYVSETNFDSGTLHKRTPEPLASDATHDALHDVRSLAHWLKHMQKIKKFKSLDQLPTDLPLRDPRSQSYKP